MEKQTIEQAAKNYSDYRKNHPCEVSGFIAG